MAYKDQCWISKTLYGNSKGALTAQLESWWYPPPTPAPNTNAVPCPENYFLRRLFLWMPKRMWGVDLKCPWCTDPQRLLMSKGLYTRVRMVLDIKDFYYLAAEYHSCKGCKGTYIAWDRRLQQLLVDVGSLFPVVLTYQCWKCDVSVVSMLRARSVGNSSTALQKKIKELHSEDWMRKTISYLVNCHQFITHKRSQWKVFQVQNGSWRVMYVTSIADLTSLRRQQHPFMARF